MIWLLEGESTSLNAGSGELGSLPGSSLRDDFCNPESYRLLSVARQLNVPAFTESLEVLHQLHADGGFCHFERRHVEGLGKPCCLGSR